MKLKSNKLKQDNQQRTTKLKNRLVNPNYKKNKINPEFKTTINDAQKKIIAIITTKTKNRKNGAEEKRLNRKKMKVDRIGEEDEPGIVKEQRL